MPERPEIDTIEFRSALENHLGAATYKKFVASLHRPSSQRGRLLYWQEVIWQKFVANHPQFSCGFDELRQMLNICELHRCEFATKTVPVLQGNVDWVQDYCDERMVRFTHCSIEVFSTEGRPITATSVQIRYCPACDEVRETTRWRTKPKHKIRSHRPTTE
jgi:hypothetical protein